MTKTSHISDGIQHPLGRFAVEHCLHCTAFRYVDEGGELDDWYWRHSRTPANECPRNIREKQGGTPMPSNPLKSRQLPDATFDVGGPIKAREWAYVVNAGGPVLCVPEDGLQAVFDKGYQLECKVRDLEAQLALRGPVRITVEQGGEKTEVG